MLNRMTTGIVLSMALALAVTGYLWRNAADDAKAAQERVRGLEANLAAVVDAERRSRELADAVQEVLLVWRETREQQQAELAATRRTLNEIRAAAREETLDASLACAVLPVPASVDRLLRREP
ncbi:hypothetical protein [Billgrantia desiderata]|uniref:hypothetical protein n=1 Tax=Billgrantia desiderata TaxID=52021 RepID=UPI001F1BF80A|nr:hypothetical protein [Halomonas desiderata]MCE8012865.1 hypothetical protein [Halomonas desiderata]